MFNIDKDLYKDYSFRAKMDAQLNKWIKWSTNIGLDNNNYRYNGTSNYAMTIARLESNISPSFVPSILTEQLCNIQTNFMPTPLSEPATVAI